MAEDDSVSDQTTPGGEMRIQSENIAFAPGELVYCGGCGRQNPPNRVQCLYCGSDLEIDRARTDVATLKLRPVEEWEPGFNVILRSIVDPKDPRMAKIAALLAVEPAAIAVIAAANRPMPLARLGSQREAELVVASLASDGLDAFFVADERLMPERPPTRLRGIEINDTELGLIDFNTRNTVHLPREDLALIVPGVISEKRTDQLEKKRRGKEAKVLEQMETGRDEAVLDIYGRNDPTGFRVLLTGFDFSCLGTDKSYLAVENIRRLTDALHEFAPNAALITDYRDQRAALGAVWPVDDRKDSRGMQRSGFAKFEFGNTLSSSNLRQLNRFSRLQWHLL